jgi:hypothetical protein
VQLGREPDLGVHHTVGGQVLGALGGHPGQRLGRLHDRDRVPERLQVQLQMPAPGRPGHRPGQRLGVVAGQVAVPDGLRQLNDRGGPQTTVQVVVQQHLGHGPDLIERQRHSIMVPRSDFRLHFRI